MNIRELLDFRLQMIREFDMGLSQLPRFFDYMYPPLSGFPEDLSHYTMGKEIKCPPSLYHSLMEKANLYKEKISAFNVELSRVPLGHYHDMKKEIIQNLGPDYDFFFNEYLTISESEKVEIHLNNGSKIEIYLIILMYFVFLFLTLYTKNSMIKLIKRFRKVLFLRRATARPQLFNEKINISWAKYGADETYGYSTDFSGLAVLLTFREFDNDEDLALTLTQDYEHYSSLYFEIKTYHEFVHAAHYYSKRAAQSTGGPSELFRRIIDPSEAQFDKFREPKWEADPNKYNFGEARFERPLSQAGAERWRRRFETYMKYGDLLKTKRNFDPRTVSEYEEFLTILGKTGGGLSENTPRRELSIQLRGSHFAIFINQLIPG